MDYHLEVMIDILDIESNEVRIVGICGMGGIGKTTIAKAVYNQISNNYEGSSFLTDFREYQGQLGLVSLQKQLYLDILREKNSFISSVSRGSPLIQERFCSKKILVILDGVDKEEQLKALAGGRDWFGPSSRIIITSRDESLLKRLDVQEIYKPKELDPDRSLQLLCMHAFGRDHPPWAFSELPKELASAAGGLPLALEILGSSLKNNKIERDWKETLKKLKKFPDNKLKQILQISYDALDPVQKDMFLDIACFFIGMDKQYAIDIFEACDFFPNTGIDALIDKSLVKMHHNKLIMHDLLRDMGRHIVYEESPKYPGKRSRLWNYKDALDVLKMNWGSKKVECLVLNPEGREIGSKKVDLRAEAFARMPRLRLLQVNDACIKGDFKPLFKKLRWLCWQRCPLKFIPTNFQPVELVILDLSHSPVLTKTPNFVGLPSLGRLILEGCTRLSSVHRSIGDLKKLVFLNLKDCINLVGFPSSPYSLEILILSNCSRFSSLPADLGNMKALTELLLDNTAIEQLPDSIGGLRKLSTLSLRKGESESRMLISLSRSGTPLNLELGRLSVRALQNSVGSLMMLGWTFIRSSIFQRESYDCKITKLPASFSDLCSLQKLDLSNCNLPEDAIPSDFGRLSSLKQLFLDYNNFSSLPNSIAHLSRLERLSLNHCTKLQSLPEDFGRLSSLINLTLVGCKNFSSLPNSIAHLSQLEWLYLNDCTKLQSLPEDFGRLSPLTCLSLTGCKNLSSLPTSISCLSQLHTILLDDCTKLQSLPEDLRRLSLLRYLELGGCNNLCSLYVSGPSNLSVLRLRGCTKLQSLPETLPPLLRYLQLSGCNNLCSLPDSITNLPRLWKLFLWKCTKLQSLPQLPHGLVTLDVRDCVSMESLPDLSNVDNVLVSGCENLAVIENLERLESSSSFHCFMMGRCNTTGMTMNLVQGICERSRYVTLPGREVPEWFTHRNSLSCEVPPLDDDRQIQGFIVCFLVKRVVDKQVPWVDIPMNPAIHITRNNKGFSPFESWGIPRYSCPADVVDCIHLFRVPNRRMKLQEGDQIQVSATFGGEFQVTNGGIHFFTN